MKAFNYIVADRFFKDYLPSIPSYKHKLRGKNWRGNPTQFSDQEIQLIRQALKKLFKDIIP